MPNNLQNGIAIALAWPEKSCKQPGSWYDGLMTILGFNQNLYYKVGHAAIVLANKETGNLHYFDFGRYHTPVGFGRVRDELTDHDLKITTKANFEGTRITNINAIIEEIHNNPSCHGAGPIHASQCFINFKESYSRAKKFQEKGVLRYGPFIWKGTNCARFVRSVLLPGVHCWKQDLKIRFPWSVTPVPFEIVKSLSDKAAYGLNNIRA